MAKNTDGARAIINHLAEAWNAYLKEYGYQATPQNTDDLNDFRKVIHDGQRIVGCREAERVVPELFGK